MKFSSFTVGLAVAVLPVQVNAGCHFSKDRCGFLDFGVSVHKGQRYASDCEEKCFLFPTLAAIFYNYKCGGCGGLSDPAEQPKFVEIAPNALDPAFLYKDFNENGQPPKLPYFRIKAAQTFQKTGLINPLTGEKLKTTVWGYGDDTVSWPGQTIQVKSYSAGGCQETHVEWRNRLPSTHLLPVDTSLHWAYGLHGDSSANGVDYRQFSIERDGVPMIVHLHGGRTDFQFDGTPEFFFSPNERVIGPQWDDVDGGFQNTFRYNNNVTAGNLWYHDHALGITRLSIYAGLAGFYFIRDQNDTGMPDNPLNLPAFPYELAYIIQDRIFTDHGELFYPAFPGDPSYDDFIDENVNAPTPTALAEFFGDHMVVNGKIWPKVDVEPRNYRMRLLNVCDSRFLVIQFVVVAAHATDPKLSTEDPLSFYVIGSDQGLGTPQKMDTLVIGPAERFDIVLDFSQAVNPYTRVILKNIGGDFPFGGDIPGDERFDYTDRIMAFDVSLAEDTTVPDNFDSNDLPAYTGVPGAFVRTRKVALMEGRDAFGRIQPLLGTVADDYSLATAYTWFQDATETPTCGETEVWEILNLTADGHPIHLHLVNFEILDRATFEYTIDGIQITQQHNGMTGEVDKVTNIRNIVNFTMPPDNPYYEDAPKDMVTVLPGDPEADPPTGQLVRIKVYFPKPGRYVWHCHINSHEDNEMMRVLQVQQGGCS